jgi:cell wall assembly regulator SMI1
MPGVEPEASDEEVAQEVRHAWAGLLSAAEWAGYAPRELVRPPASARQVAEAEEAIGRPLPRDLAALYQLSDGQVDWIELAAAPGPNVTRRQGQWVGSLFGAGWTFNRLDRLRSEYRAWAQLRAHYTPDELADEFDGAVAVRGGDPVKPRYTCAGWIPFATDGGGNSLAADLAPEPGGTVGQVIVTGPDEDLRRVLAPSVRGLLERCAARLRDPGMLPEIADGVALYPLESPALRAPEVGRAAGTRGVTG